VGLCAALPLPYPMFFAGLALVLGFSVFRAAAASSQNL